MAALQAAQGQIGKDKDSLVQELKALVGEDVDAMLKQGGEDGLTEQTLRRWLVARQWNLKAAHADLSAHALWRVKMMPNGRISEDEVKNHTAQKKGFCQAGLDSSGHPVLIVDASKHIPSDVESIRKYICYGIDVGVKCGQLSPNWDGKIISIIDLSGMTMANYDVSALRAIFDLLQNHYPERLFKLYLYEAPFIFYGLWKLVSPFIDPVTKEKVVFVFKDNLEAFNKDLPASTLPTQLGGTAKLRTLEEAWQDVLAASTAQPGP